MQDVRQRGRTTQDSRGRSRRTYGSTRQNPYQRTQRGRGRGYSRGFYNRSVTTFQRGPLPNILYTKFRFSEVTTGTVSNTAPLYYFLGYANNPYDPVVGVSTVACSGFNSIMAIYQWCMCYGCKIEVTFSQQLVTSLLPDGYGFIYMENHDAYRNSNPSVLMSLDWLRENPIHCKSVLMTSPVQNTLPKKISLFRRIRSIEGVTYLDPWQYRCSRTTGPALNSRYTFGYRTTDATSSVAQTIRMHFTVTYYCKCYERLNVDQ